MAFKGARHQSLEKTCVFHYWQNLKGLLRNIGAEDLKPLLKGRTFAAIVTEDDFSTCSKRERLHGGHEGHFTGVSAFSVLNFRAFFRLLVLLRRLARRNIGCRHFRNLVTENSAARAFLRPDAGTS